MPALEFTGASTLSWVIADIPVADSMSVLVEVENIGICGTDLHLFTGSSAYIRTGMTRYPFVPGHEFAGRVVAVGDAVTTAEVGDRVVGEPFLPCGSCRTCRSGSINLCPNRAEQGVRGNVPGAAAQFVRVPVGNVVVVPDSVPSEYALLAEPSVTVLHCLDATGVQPGERVAVIGSGTLGIIATQVLSHAGMHVETIGIDSGLTLALEAGARRILHPDEAPNDSYDVVIEASGAPTALALALRIAGIGGRVAQAGIPGRESSGVDAALLVTKGITVFGVLGGTAYLARAVQLIADGIIDPSIIVGPIRPWHDAVGALTDMAAGGLAQPKIVLDLTGLDMASAAGHGVQRLRAEQ